MTQCTVGQGGTLSPGVIRKYVEDKSWLSGVMSHCALSLTFQNRLELNWLVTSKLSMEQQFYLKWTRWVMIQSICWDNFTALKGLMSTFVLKNCGSNRLLIHNTNKKFIKENLSYYLSYSGLEFVILFKVSTWSSEVSHEWSDYDKEHVLMVQWISPKILASEYLKLV